MQVEIKDDAIRVVILDITGIYVQIYDQGYFDLETVKEIQIQHSDTEHWRVLVLDKE